MNVLVYPHEMIVGGSQINALELAASVRDLGHNVTVLAPEGPLLQMVEELGLPMVRTSVTTEYPSPRTIGQLIRLVRKLRVDIVHAYEWRPAVEATFGPHLFCGVPALITVLSMNVPKFLPTHIPLVVGTRELELNARSRQTYLIEPPIDTERNCICDPASARARWSFRDDEIVVSVVCRLTTDLEKLQGVLEAIDAVADLAARVPIRLLVVGDGSGLSVVKQRAQAVNARLSRCVVLAVGQMMDPREAYDAADIVLGMGSSVLRGMAFSKPVVVQGTGGFWRLLDQGSLDLFLMQGWFGHGGRGAEDLADALLLLASDPDKRTALGRFGREVVVSKFSLNRAAEQLLRIYERTIWESIPAMTRARSLARSAARVAKFRMAMALKARASAFADPSR